MMHRLEPLVPVLRATRSKLAAGRYGRREAEGIPPGKRRSRM